MTLTALTDRRELAHRANDGLEVTLFWSKSSNRVTLEVFDSRSGQRLEFDVDGYAALDAFKHPYVYAAKRMFAGGPASVDATARTC
ncbi:MAG TPA: hypothetical protein VMB27_26530 [Solirubrobacteraceae bacterium]|nr:hypothetical protein [Solirubrobacteraceae bacterium]